MTKPLSFPQYHALVSLRHKSINSIDGWVLEDYIKSTNNRTISTTTWNILIIKGLVEKRIRKVTIVEYRYIPQEGE